MGEAVMVPEHELGSIAKAFDKMRGEQNHGSFFMQKYNVVSDIALCPRVCLWEEN